MKEKLNYISVGSPINFTDFEYYVYMIRNKINRKVYIGQKKVMKLSPIISVVGKTLKQQLKSMVKLISNVLY